MIGLLKGYYGYKNFGDEVLLLGIIPYLFAHYPLEVLYIESADTARLKTWLDRHSQLLEGQRDKITLIEKHTATFYQRDELFLGGGEVVTDGRPFPYNGRNYLFRHPKTIFQGTYHLFGGIGTPKGFFSLWLWKFLLGHAKSIIVREKKSYTIVKKYRPTAPTILYHDFAEDVLPDIIHQLPFKYEAKKPSKALLNVNPYIRSSKIKKQLIDYASSYDQAVYFPAEIGVDDTFFQVLSEKIPHLQVYDWTAHSLPEICQEVATCSGAIAARLHVLWLAKLLNIPFKPLVYQEKISTFLAKCSGELS